MTKQIYKLIHIMALILSISTFCQAAVTTADYEVPVDNLALVEASHFPINNVTIQNRNDGPSTITYMIPQELTGFPNLIKLGGSITGSQGLLSTEYSHMDCSDGSDGSDGSSEITCRVKYNKLNISPTLANRLLAKKFSGEALQKRMLVQQIFSTDPVGIIHIKK